MEYETYADVIDAYNADNMGYSTLTDYIKGQNIKIKEIEMDPIGDMRKIFENKADGGRIGFDVGGSVIEKVASFFFDDEGNASQALQRAKFEISKFISGMGTDLETGAEWYNKLEPEEQREIIEEKMKYRERGELGGVPVYDEKYAGKFGIGGNYADGGAIGIEVLFTEKKPRKNFFMGGPALEGQALNIYNSMNAYGFSDQEIANALQEQGLYTPGGSAPETTQPNIIAAQLNQGGGDDRVTGLQETFTKDLSGDPRFSYLTPQQQANKYRFDRSVEPRDGLMGLFDKTRNFFAENRFFQPKIRGTLGTRLANQPRLPLPASIAAYSMSPFNPDSRNFNPNFEAQLNFLETRGPGFIGRDEQSGLLKYGSDSVLAGKNVISGFGTNDYEQMLMDYISKMSANTRISDARKTAQLNKAKAELAALTGKNVDNINIDEINTLMKIAKTNKISTQEAAGIMSAIADQGRESAPGRGDAGNPGGSSGAMTDDNEGTFCFDPNTLVQMADGSEKKIKEIQLGDQTKGGEVTGVFQFKASDEIHDYKGVVVAGSHYVKEDGKFIMVQDSPISVKIDKIPVVYSLDTTGRRIFINDIEFADYNGDGVAKNFLTNAGVDLTGFDTEVLRQVEQRLI